MVKDLPANARDLRDAYLILGSGRFLEEMTTHSSVLAWRVPMDRRAWRATVYGVTLPSLKAILILTASSLYTMLFVQFMGFSRQEYWNGLPFPPLVDHVFSSLQYDLSVLGGLAWHGS